MPHVYSNTIPGKAMTEFDKVGYLKQIQDSELGNFERQVLSLLALYADADSTVPFKAYNGQTIAGRLNLSASTVGRVLQRLKKGKLLGKTTRRGRRFWVLPSEDKIVAYSPKKKK